ncbi:hypothetical protein MY4824_006140 [Beauveria thailandica]
MQSLRQSRAIRHQAETHVRMRQQRGQQAINSIENIAQHHLDITTRPNSSVANDSHNFDIHRTDNEENPQTADLGAMQDRGERGYNRKNSLTATPLSEDEVAQSFPDVTVRRELRNSTTGPIFIVKWHNPDDPSNPRSWGTLKRSVVTFEVSLISAVMVIASSITSAALPQAAEDFGVSKVTESLATGLFLVGVGTGSLIAGPFSETFGRNAVYMGSLVIFMAWILGCALSSSIGAQLVFRFLAGCSASTPIVCSGGTVADLWTSLEKTWSFFIYVSLGFGAAVLGPVIGAYIGPADTLDWRWVEWIVLILSAALLVHVLLFMPETYGPLLLRWKASHYRQITGDARFVAEDDLAGSSFLGRLRISMTRPFLMLTEPIIIAMTLYITVLYIILFTFLIGWTYIFEETYGISQGLTHVIFIAMFIGMQLVVILIPFIYRKTAQAIHCQSGESTKKCVGFNPELRLWFAMLGPAFAIPISLFWMGWTARPDISIWSPILAAVLFGFGMSGMFICVYLYVIDSYEVYSASALTFASLVRYFAAGGMTVAGIPFYENMGTAYTLTILASISLVLVPVSYLLYFYGHKLRARRKYAVSWD